MSFKNKNMISNTPLFTHFAAIPFIKPEYRQFIFNLQTDVKNICKQYGYNMQGTDILKEHSHRLCHTTLFKINLKRNQIKAKMLMVMKNIQQKICSELIGHVITVKSIQYFTRLNKNEKLNEITVIYLELDEHTQQVLRKLSDFIIRTLLKEEIIVPEELKFMNVVYDHHANLYRAEKFHISLFRARNLMENQMFLEMFQKVRGLIKEIEFKCEMLDISTMQEYQNDNQFYLPFYRAILSKNIEQSKEIKELQQKP